MLLRPLPFINKCSLRYHRSNRATRENDTSFLILTNLPLMKAPLRIRGFCSCGASFARNSDYDAAGMATKLIIWIFAKAGTEEHGRRSLCAGQGH
jgi:hypothetical protein